MTIWLADKCLDDLVQIPLSLDNGRLDVQPNEDNHVYVVNKHFYHYQLIPEETSELKKHGYDIGGSFARVGYRYHLFRDDSGNIQKLKYWDLELWDRIPEELRDVFFYHEVTEAIHLAKGLTQPEAHTLARVADLIYRQENLSLEEQEQFIK